VAIFEGGKPVRHNSQEKQTRALLFG